MTFEFQADWQAGGPNAAPEERANPPSPRSPVNDLRNAARQATGRAFAAELLAPLDEVLSMQEDDKSPGDMAEDFGVAREVVARQLQNRERIRAALRSSERAG